MTRCPTLSSLSVVSHRLCRVARQRLSHRLNDAAPDGPFEDIPAHLRHVIGHWFETVTGQIGQRPYQAAAVRELAVRFRLNVPADYTLEQFFEIFDAMLDNDEYALDLIDATLDVLGPRENDWQTLQHHLDVGASAWKVADDYISLTRVVADEMRATLDAAMVVVDEITTEMREAWLNAFGRNGDPSDAWDHAIKAMEALFIPIVIPSKAKASLGGVIGELRNQGHVWKIVLPGKDQNHDVAPLVAMLDGIWPNVDRHAGSGTTRPPTPEEARAVVTLAATIVQWHRDGWVVQRR